MRLGVLIEQLKNFAHSAGLGLNSMYLKWDNENINDIRIENDIYNGLPNGRGIYLYSSEFATPMTVADLIQATVDADENMQVMDAEGSRVIFSYAKPNELRNIYIRYIDEIDAEEMVSNVFKKSKHEGMEEYDIFIELGEMGFTLIDLVNTSMFDYINNYTQNHCWEE